MGEPMSITDDDRFLMVSVSVGQVELARALRPLPDVADQLREAGLQAWR
jgi:hypothetical protein